MLAQPAGKEGVKRWFETWTDAVTGSTLDVTTIVGVRDFVLMETVVRGTLTGAFGPVFASNSRSPFTAVSSFSSEARRSSASPRS
jgi:hypothetical protein